MCVCMHRPRFSVSINVAFHQAVETHLVATYPIEDGVIWRADSLQYKVELFDIASRRR